MKRTALLAAALMVVGFAACEDQPEVGPVIHRDGLISDVKDDQFGAYQYKDVILSGVALCDDDESIEVHGDITQGTVNTSVEGGFECKAGQTVKWLNNFGRNGSFPPDPRLEPGVVEVELYFDSYDTGDRVIIRRKVTLHEN